MTTRHKLFATWKNQVKPVPVPHARRRGRAGRRQDGRSVRVVGVSVDDRAGIGAQATAGKLAVTAQNMGWDDNHSLTGETSASDLIEIGCGT